MIDFSTPLAGLDRATSSLNQTATKIASADIPGDKIDLSGEMVALLVARSAFTANTKLLQTEDQLSQSSLNILG